MNFIEFNKQGIITKSNINNIYATSNNADELIIFAEFDSSPIGNIEASVMFKRSDGVIIGPLIANEAIVDGRFCRKVLLGDQVLKVPGPLQMTVRYQEFDIVDGSLVPIKTRVAGMVTTNIYDAIF